MADIIKRVKDIKHPDAFDSFEWIGQDLKRLNLLYGWNGCGKTTLSRVLNFLERKNIHLLGFSKIDFNIVSSSGSVKPQDVVTHPLNIRVFNEDFIRENLTFEESKAKKIVMIGKEVIATREEIKKLESDQAVYQAAVEALSAGQSKLAKPDAILTDAGRAVTKQFGNTPLANDQYYGRNYNKARVEKRLTDGTIAEANLKSLILPQAELDSQRDLIKSERQKVTFSSPPLADFSDAFGRANELLNVTVAVKEIGTLKDDEPLRTWTDTGFHIHKERKSKTCLFCQGTLHEGFLVELGDFFTDELEKTKGEIDGTVRALEMVSRNEQGTNLDSGELLPDIAKQYLEAKSEIEAASKSVKAAIDSLTESLRRKKEQLLDPNLSLKLVDYPAADATKYNEQINTAKGLIDQHNRRIEKGAEETAKAAKRVEMHTIASTLSDRDYFKAKKTIDDIAAKLAKAKIQLGKITSDINTKKASLLNANVAIDKINAVLKEFFGDQQIYLETTDLGKGEVAYVLKRRGKDAKYLSEGEKSVLALIYFFIKLEEDGCDKKTCVTIVDDPVDSQDSIFLFRTFGLLKRQLNDSGQLIILTHNFEFFNLVRDWLVSANNGTDSGLYLISLNRDSKRSMIVEDLPELLREYKSEYQYLFCRLFRYANGTKPLDEPLVANIGRKVLEYFACFKWSCKTTEQFTSIVLNRFVADANHLRKGTGDFVVKFLHEYSHGQDFSRPISAPMLEAKAIAENIIAFLRLADKEHYLELEALCS